MYSEGPVTQNYQDAVDQAIAENKLISVRSLSSNFPAAHAGASLSDAQSRSLVEFLNQVYKYCESFPHWTNIGMFVI